jgi:hypothetical protein
MNTRPISIIAIIQAFALICAILTSATAARLIDTAGYTGYKLPEILNYSFYLRHYGLWCFLLIALWSIVAVYSHKLGADRCYAGILIAGILFILFLLAVAVSIVSVAVLQMT